MSSRDTDLSALARPETERRPGRPPSRWAWRLIPLVIVIGFVAIFFDAARDLFTEAKRVTVVRPQSVTDAQAAAGAVLFQAAGWVEPDPFPIRVTALADGVVRRMLVDESEAIESGQPVAELVVDDAALSVAAADAALGRARAARDEAGAELANATESFEAAIDVTEAIEVARADVDAWRAEEQHRAAAVVEARAAILTAQRELDTQRYLREQGAVGPWQVELAETRLAETRAKVEQLEGLARHGTANVESAKAKLKSAERNLELRLAERLRVDVARTAVARADAIVTAAEVKRDEAQLRRDRMTVRSPAAGIVLRRDAEPGSVVGPKGAALCVLYDPKRLRVRVDVPQTQVSNASVGQEAEIRCEVRRDRPYRGEILRIVHTADIQKVTLEVQVRVTDPDGLLKPDMLCQVRVMGSGEATTASKRSVAVRIPARCLVGNDAVWVVDGETGRAARRTVRAGDRRGDDVVIVEGLNLSDKVIDGGRTGLDEGDPLRVEETR